MISLNAKLTQEKHFSSNEKICVKLLQCNKEHWYVHSFW